MNAYIISTKDADGVEHVRFAGSQGDASAARRSLMADHGVKMAAVDISDVDIPTSKKDLLSFLNELMKR